MSATDDTALIVIPGLRPPVPPRRDRLGKRRPAAGLTRRIARTGDTALAAGLGLAALGVAFALSVPTGIGVAVLLVAQVVLHFRRPAQEVPRV